MLLGLLTVEPLGAQPTGHQGSRGELQGLEFIANEAAARHRAMDYFGAVTVLEPAVVRAREEGDVYWHGRLLAQKGRSWANAGSRHRANEDLSEAVDLFSVALADAPSDRGRLGAELEFARGGLLLINGQRADALEAWRLAADALRAAGDLNRAAEVDADRANAMSAGQPREAIALAESVLREVNQVLDPQAARALGAKAYALQTLDRRAQALTAYDAVIPMSARHNDQQTLRFAYCNRAELLRLAGRYQDAEADLRAAVEGFEHSRDANQLLGEERTNFLERQVSAYERWILLLVDTYRGNQAFDIAERFHARSFLDMLRERDLDLAARRVPDLRRREQELYAAMAELRFGTRTGGQATDSADQEDETKFQRLAVELAQHHSQMRLQEPRYGRLSRPAPPEQALLRAALAEGEVLVAYWKVADRLIAWSLTRTATFTTQLPLEPGALEAQIEGFTAPLRSEALADDQSLNGGDAAHVAVGRALYDTLIRPLPLAVQTAQRLVIVRHGDLNRLAFEALIENCETAANAGAVADVAPFYDAYRHCRFLGTEKEIVYAPSGASMLELRERSQRVPALTSKPVALAMAPGLVAVAGEGTSSSVRRAIQRAALLPLRFAQDEVRAIGRLMPESDVLLADAATESSVRELLQSGQSRYSVLHFATHGLVDDTDPMTSALLLEGDAQQDGLMLAGEVLGLDLNAELVTLSACKTARGQLRRGEGFVGLQQAFLYAGASSVLASLWDVDDEATLVFMTTFYGHLAGGKRRAAALLATRRELLSRTLQRRVVVRERSVSLAHPRYWAAFVLTGEP